MRVMLTMAALMGILFSAAGATAQTPPAESSDRVLDFEGDVIETSFLKPDASLIEGELRKEGTSLLKVRKDFIPELVKSAEDI